MRRTYFFFVFEFLHEASTFVRSTAVCSTTFRRELLLQLLDPYHIISTAIALQDATQVEVVYLPFRFLCEEHLAFYRPVHFDTPGAAVIFAYNAAIRLATTS